MAHVISTDLEDVNQKTLLAQKEKDLDSELHICEDKLRDFNKNNY